MSRRLRICMAKGGRGSLRPSYGRPKLTHVSRFVATQIGFWQSKSLRQFSSERSEIESTWTHRPGIQVDSISIFQDFNISIFRTKIGGVTLIGNTSDFL